MKRVTRALLAVIGVIAALTPALAANGTLKVTSFPSGAEVWVDGANTGKVTPMSVSLAEGDHTVTVQLPNSGWNPDTRTVTIVPGNNDLSVTLLPMVTAGSPGPQGPPGAPATVRLAAPGECPTGGIVVTSGNGDVSLPVCNGAQGPQGIQGTQGLQGIQGIQGIQGEAGRAGPPGPAGGAPAVDPTTLVGFGSNLLVDIDGPGASQYRQFGLSPVYVEVGEVAQTDSRGGVTYSAGKVSVAPFAIAASGHLRDESGDPVSDYGPELATWFEAARRNEPEAARAVHFKLTGEQNIVRLTVEMAGCLPTAIDTDFAGVTRVVVACHHVSNVTAIGGEVHVEAGQHDSLYLPQPYSPQQQLFVRVQGASDPQFAGDVSGGGKRIERVGSEEYVAVDPLRMRTGSAIDNFDIAAIKEWIVASLASDLGGQYRDVDLLGPDQNTVVAQYSDMFLTRIGLIDPARTFGGSSETRLASIRVGFDLVMRVRGEQ